MTMAERPTDTARTTMKTSPTTRTRTPLAAANSRLSELSRSGRAMTPIVASTTQLSSATSGSVDDCTVKIEPKRINWVVPVEALLVARQVEEQGGEPGRRAQDDTGRDIAALHSLHTDGVHGSRTKHATTDETDDRRHAGEKGSRATGGRHVGERVTREGLAAQHGEDTHDSRHDRHRQPHEQRGAHRVVGEEAGFEEPMHVLLDHEFWVFAHQVFVLVTGTGHHQDPAVHSQHVDVMAVERAQHIGADDLVRRAAGDSTVGDVDDPVHHR